MLRYTTDRARPGLVALYDIRPGNGAGQFLQPRSPHGARVNVKDSSAYTCVMFGTMKGRSASVVTTHGDIVVPKLLPRNGPRGTYSHF